MYRKTLNKLSFFLFILFLLISSDIAAQNNSANKPAKIELSNVIEALLKRKEQNPKISPKELADFGNELIKTKGYDFSFYACGIAEGNEQKIVDERFNGSLRPYNYQLKDITGKQTTFPILNQYYDIPCGCAFDLPIFQISDKAMTVRVDSSQLKLIIPEEFGTDEVELVDKSLKKTSRKWFMPSDNVPLGISKDGTKIYIDTGYDDYALNRLALEISENGAVKYVARTDPNIILGGKELKNFPKDPDNSYLGYKRFIAGKKSYFIKFSYPCT